MLKELKELEKVSNKHILAAIDTVGRDKYEATFKRVKVIMDARMGDLGVKNDAYAKLIIASVIVGLTKGE